MEGKNRGKTDAGINVVVSRERKNIGTYRTKRGGAFRFGLKNKPLDYFCILHQEYPTPRRIKVSKN
jgi:hypothetical protein